MRKIAYVLMAVLLVLCFVGSCKGQLNTKTRQIRFGEILKAADTAATAENSGRFWYDFNSEKFRVNQNGTNADAVVNTSSLPYIKSTGSTEIGVNTMIQKKAGENSSLTLVNIVSAISNQDGQSIIFESGNYGVTDYFSMHLNGGNSRWYYGNTDFEEHGINLDVTTLTVQVNESIGTYFKIVGLPTSSPCATAGSGTVWNNGGVLNICP